MSHPSESNIATPPRARANRVRRWLLRLLRIVAIVYLVLVLVMSMLQEHLIFPGAYMSVPANVARVPTNGESFRLTLPDGIQVAGLFLPARAAGTTTTSAGRRPTILYFYGNGSALAVSAAELNLFRNCGANVLSIDYPGYGASTGKPSEANCYAAAAALWDYALTRPEIDPDQIIVVGWSLGGAVALDLAHKHPSIRGLMLISSFTSMDDMAHLIMPFLPTGLFLRHHFLNINKIPDIHCPIIITHGQDDPMIPYSMSLRLRDAATGSSSVRQFPIAGAEHNDIFAVGARSISAALADLINTLGHPKPTTSSTAPDQ